MNQDCKVRRGIFINKSVEIREQLHFASPEDILKAFDVYCVIAMGQCCGHRYQMLQRHISSAGIQLSNLSIICPEVPTLILLRVMLQRTRQV